MSLSLKHMEIINASLDSLILFCFINSMNLFFISVLVILVLF